jgi:hypothetical protein
MHVGIVRASASIPCVFSRCCARASHRDRRPLPDRPIHLQRLACSPPARVDLRWPGPSDWYVTLSANGRPGRPREPQPVKPRSFPAADYGRQRRCLSSGGKNKKGGRRKGTLHRPCFSGSGYGDWRDDVDGATCRYRRPSLAELSLFPDILPGFGGLSCICLVVAGIFLAGLASGSCMELPNQRHSALTARSLKLRSS